MEIRREGQTGGGRTEISGLRGTVKSKESFDVTSREREQPSGGNVEAEKKEGGGARQN